MAIRKTFKVGNWSIEMDQRENVKVGKDEFLLPSFTVMESRQDAKGHWQLVGACSGLLGTEAAGAYFNSRIAEMSLAVGMAK